VKREVPSSIIQEEKKGIRSFMIVFIKIRAVIGFSGDFVVAKAGKFPGMIAGIK
jgi:hypothetical protein